MTRTKLLLAAAVIAGSARSLAAQRCGGRTIDEVIASCDAAFPGYNPLIISARGWCYIINGSCLL